MSKSSGVRLTAAERKEKILAYRRLNHSFAEIAKATGCSTKYAFDVVTDYLRELAQRNSHSTEELRQQELDRLDAQERRLNELIIALPIAELRHLARLEDTLLKVRQHRARLLGLLVPTQVLVPVPATAAVLSDDEQAEIVARVSQARRHRLALSAAPADTSPASTPVLVTEE